MWVWGSGFIVAARLVLKLSCKTLNPAKTHALNAARHNLSRGREVPSDAEQLTALGFKFRASLHTYTGVQGWRCRCNSIPLLAFIDRIVLAPETLSPQTSG